VDINRCLENLKNRAREWSISSNAGMAFALREAQSGKRRKKPRWNGTGAMEFTQKRGSFMSNMTPEEALRRANRAGQLFNDPMTQETLNLMEKDIYEAWIACPVRDNDGRERLWEMAVATRKFRDLLRGTMESGKMAADDIRRKQSAAEKLKERASRAFGGFTRGY